jgi:hypothetical protein
MALIQLDAVAAPGADTLPILSVLRPGAPVTLRARYPRLANFGSQGKTPVYYPLGTIDKAGIRVII